MCTAFTPELTDFLAKNGEKSAVLVSSDFTQAREPRAARAPAAKPWRSLQIAYERIVFCATNDAGFFRW